MKKREIKFQVRDAKTKKVIGYERINDNGHWEQMRVGRKAWLLGCITSENDLIRSQLTPYPDKNNKEIYDNAVCKHIDGDIGFVRCDHGWAIEYSKTYSHDMPQYYCQYLEVIGNVFENAEILEA